jgi:hypothetical protein
MKNKTIKTNGKRGMKGGRKASNMGWVRGHDSGMKIWILLAGVALLISIIIMLGITRANSQSDEASQIENEVKLI